LRRRHANQSSAHPTASHNPKEAAAATTKRWPTPQTKGDELGRFINRKAFTAPSMRYVITKQFAVAVSMEIYRKAVSPYR
jgi:hypothetical protein